MTTENVKGSKDYTGEEAEKRAEIKKILVGTFEKYGFEPAETPIIEYEEFVKGNNSNDEAVSDIFKLKDKGERNLALRYEFTFQLKRIAKNKKLPYKRYQIGEVFRDEPISSNRFRQFVQCDIDIVGSSIKDEAEIIALIKDILKKLDIDFIVYFNNRKLLNEILQEQGVDEKSREEVIRILDKLDKQPESEIKKELKKYGAEKLLDMLKKPDRRIKEFQAYRDIEEFEKYCKLFGVDEIKFSPTLARGLAYYNGTIFEIKTKGKEMKETLYGGGSYLIDGIQSTGISCGLERLSSLAKIKSEKEKFMVVSIKQDKEAIDITKKLRKEGKEVILIMDKGISKCLDYANSKKIEKVVLVGEEEVKKKKFKVKSMNSGREFLFSERELLK